MAVGDVYEVQVQYQVGSMQTMNVLHFEQETAGTPVGPVSKLLVEGLHPVLANFYTSAVFSLESKIISLRAIRIKPTPSVPTLLVLGTTAFPVIPGGSSEQFVPPQVALLISLYTLGSDKTDRGRVYFPGVANDEQQDGQLVEAAIADLEVGCQQLFIDSITTAGGGPTFAAAVYSRKLGTAKEVENFVINTNLATQKGRRNHPGLGVL